MAIEDINIGTTPDDGTGDSLRVAGQKINDNFAELDTPLKLADIFEVERDGNQDITKTISLYDLQVPAESILLGNSITISDLAQTVGYKTAFDNKQYILMSYEIEEDGSKNPVIKDFGSPTEFVIQPSFDITQVFTGTASFPITSQQNVIGQIYNLKLSCLEDVRLEVVRVVTGGGVGNTIVVDEILEASSTNIDGFDFNLTPLTDFQLGAQYILKFTSVNGGDITVRGTEINTVFVPYVKRTKGWVYENKEIGFKKKYVNSKASISRPSQTTVGLINQQGNIYEEYLSLTYAPTITDNYRLSLSFSWSANNNQFNALFRVSISDGTTTEFFILRTEPKDVAGTGVVLDVLQGGNIVGQADTGTDVRLFESSFSDYILDVGKTYTVTLEWANEDANSETAIFGGFLSLEQKTINP
jgi:hypothetical protein